MDIGAAVIYASMFLALYFEVFLLISFFEKRPRAKTAALPRQFPTVAIVVPCYNEERTIAGTLDSLLALQYPTDKLSIVVVNDGSTDRTAQIAKTYAASHPNICFFDKANGGKYTALNYAIERTQTDIIGCLDADSFVAPDALVEVVKRFESEPDIMAITPAMKVYRPRNLLELMQAVEYTFGIFYKKMFDNISAINVLPGPFSLYRRDVFSIVGFFRHAHNTEDMEIAFRMHAHGLRIGNAHTAHVYTTVPKTLRALIRQRTRWSQGFLQNSRDYAYMYFNRTYGNFGMIALPFGLAAFMAGLYISHRLVLHQYGHDVVSHSSHARDDAHGDTHRGAHRRDKAFDRLVCLVFSPLWIYRAPVASARAVWNTPCARERLAVISVPSGLAKIYSCVCYHRDYILGSDFC